MPANNALFPKDMRATAEKYGLQFLLEDIPGSIVAIINKTWELDKLIQEGKDKKPETVKVTHPYDVEASKDKSAIVTAHNLVKAFTSSVEAALVKNPNVAYHLSQKGSELSSWFTYEVNYRRLVKAPKAPIVSGTKLDELRADRATLKKGCDTYLLSMTEAVNEKNEDGTYVYPDLPRKEDGSIILPNIQGASGTKAEVPTGRHAKYLRWQWVIDGKDLLVDTDSLPRELIRLIWSPLERADKKASDIFDVIEKAQKKAKSSDPLEVTINGHKVTWKVVEETK